jgi:hypothetical protein
MSTLTAEDLRHRWIQRVRALTGVASYTVQGAKNQETFRKVADRLNALNFDVERYIDAQINHVIAHNRQAGIWPTLMMGDAAIERYMKAPSGYDTIDGLREYYAAQAQAFNRVCLTMGEGVAFRNNVLHHSPLFLAFMHYSTGRNMTLELAGDARAEAAAHPLVSQVFPRAFLERL